MSDPDSPAGEVEDRSERAPTIPVPASAAGTGVSFDIGSIVAGKYLIERVIGTGGLGVVVAAKHMQLEQTVAIKYLQPSALTRPNLVERFAREARLVAKIQSAHVARVHDVGKLDDGSPYMVMEYLEGKELGELLRGGPLPIEEAIDYILQACDALAEAHALGIVHRDLKPANLFLARRSGGSTILKILDFGISKMPVKEENPSVARNQKLTNATDKFGTPEYMSPEQLKETASVDARSDIWSLGVVLHELLTGELPFTGESIPLLLAAVAMLAPKNIADVRIDVPPRLASIVRKCLEKDRDDRFRNVAELVQELGKLASPGSKSRVDHITRIIQDSGQSVRPPTPSVKAEPVQVEPVPVEPVPVEPVQVEPVPVEPVPVVPEMVAAPPPPSAPVEDDTTAAPAPGRRLVVRGAVVALVLVVLGGIAVAMARRTAPSATPQAAPLASASPPVPSSVPSASASAELVAPPPSAAPSGKPSASASDKPRAPARPPRKRR